jgi:hypothetical protein
VAAFADHYRTLGVHRHAELAVIEAAYRAMAKGYHPDRNPGDRSANTRLQQINAAYAVLSDPKKRRAYDLVWDKHHADMKDVDTWPDPDHAYALWIGDAGRNKAEVARRLGLSPNTVQAWHDRYRWRERASADLRSLHVDRVGDAERSMLEMLPATIDVKRQMYCSAHACYCGRNSPGHPVPSPDMQKHADLHLARYGIAPKRSIAVDVTAIPSPRLTPEEIEAMSVEEMIALARGLRPAPSPPLPSDFTGGQPGGRGALGPAAAPHTEIRLWRPKRRTLTHRMGRADARFSRERGEG